MKELTLPKKVKVGENWYSVDIADSMRSKMYMGEVHYAKRTITLARKSYHGVPLRLSAQQMIAPPKHMPNVPLNSEVGAHRRYGLAKE